MMILVAHLAHTKFAMGPAQRILIFTRETVLYKEVMGFRVRPGMSLPKELKARTGPRNAIQ